MNNKLLPPKFNTLPGALALAVKVKGAVPKSTKLLVKFNPIPAPDNDKLFIFLLAGIVASSVETTAAAAGAKKFNVKLYKAIRAVGAEAAVVKVPPAVVGETIPTPTVGATA